MTTPHTKPKASLGPATLYIWPKSKWNDRLSLDPGSVAALLYLQLSIPGLYTVEHTHNFDLSPSGQLPFLTHGLHSASGFQQIVKYAAQFAREGGRNLDAGLGPLERARAIARIAQVESQLGDLVAHTYYGLPANWGETRRTIGSTLPVPQRYYVPDRIRLAYQKRLEAVELWNVVGIELEQEAENIRFGLRKAKKRSKKQVEKIKFKESMERKKVTDRVSAILDGYVRLLGDQQYFFGGDYPTTLDVVFAAHVHLLLTPLPDTLVLDVLQNSYPSLVEHSKRVVQLAFPDASAYPAAPATNTGFTLRSLFPRLPQQPQANNTLRNTPAWKARERRFRLMRWGFFGTAALSFATYVYFAGIIPMYLTTLQKVREALEAQERGELELEEDIDDDEGEEDEEDIQSDV